QRPAGLRLRPRRAPGAAGGPAGGRPGLARRDRPDRHAGPGVAGPAGPPAPPGGPPPPGGGAPGGGGGGGGAGGPPRPPRVGPARVAGMGARADQVGDAGADDPAGWEPEGPHQPGAHVLVMVHAPDAADCDAAAGAAADAASAAGLVVLARQRLANLQGPAGG